MHADLIEVFKDNPLDTFFEIDSASKTRGRTWKLKKKKNQH